MVYFSQRRGCTLHIQAKHSQQTVGKESMIFVNERKEKETLTNFMKNFNFRISKKKTYSVKALSNSRTIND